MIIYILGLYVLSLLWGYELTYYRATRIIGSSARKGLQAAIMSPWFATLGLILYAVILGSVVYGFINYGWLVGIGVFVGLIISMALNKAFLLPKNDSEHFRRIIISSLMRRYVNFLRRGDEFRASIVEYILERLGIPVSEIVAKLKGGKVCLGGHGPDDRQ